MYAFKALSFVAGFFAVVSAMPTPQGGASVRGTNPNDLTLTTAGQDVNSGTAPGFVKLAQGLGAPVPRSPPDYRAVGNGVADTTGPHDTRDVEKPSLLQTFQVAIVKLDPVLARLKASVSVGVKIDVDVIVGLLQEVVVILTSTLEQLQIIVDDPVGFALSIPEVAHIIGALLATLLGVLVTVFEAVVLVDATAKGVLTPIIAEIDALLASIIATALIIVPGLLATLLEIVTPLKQFIVYLNLIQVAQILGLSL